MALPLLRQGHFIFIPNENVIQSAHRLFLIYPAHRRLIWMTRAAHPGLNN
jgi:hypothetical protein